ncbi:hypothetical protein DENSPDRAFT_883663 [Dentipellis sp. KUC8613]|nr:hypothetical protein DENSPDRAFT_883663 [Dentipellis sp. KUC8613]
MHHTAWTSDALRPARKPSPQPAKQKGKGKGKDKENAPPRSPAARRLDALIAALQPDAPPPPPTHSAPACFCQARSHPLSRFTPLCKRCGLVLCALQRPHAPCPACGAPLLTPPARAALLAQLQAELDDTLAREERARLRALEDARAAAGAFPTLGQAGAGGAGGDAGGLRGAEQTHRVLSLDAKTKRVTVASYAPGTPLKRDAGGSGSGSGRGGGDGDGDGFGDEGEERVPRPPSEVPHAKGPRETWQRWADLRGPPVAYVDPPKPRGREGKRRGGGARGS